MARLRSHGHPATLFGETDRMRCRRLDEVLSQRKTEEDHAREVAAMGPMHRPPQTSTQNGEELRAALSETSLQEAFETHAKYVADLKGVYPVTEKEKDDFVFHSLEKFLSQWGVYALKKKNDGEVRKYLTTCEDIEPLVASLQKHKTNVEILVHLCDIMSCMNVGDYTSAELRYFRLSIGDDPWPMGIPISAGPSAVTRERISDVNVKHWMNNTVVRRYVHAILRLLQTVQELEKGREE